MAKGSVALVGWFECAGISLDTSIRPYITRMHTSGVFYGEHSLAAKLFSAWRSFSASGVGSIGLDFTGSRLLRLAHFDPTGYSILVFPKHHTDPTHFFRIGRSFSAIGSSGDGNLDTGFTANGIDLVWSMGGDKLASCLHT